MNLTIAFIAFLLCATSNVAAHGYLSSVDIDGKTYKGNVPNQPATDSPIRLIDDIGPVKGADNPNLACGQHAQNAALVAAANPGSKVAFGWSDNGSNWPHQVGPLMTYMASCKGTPCDQFDASGARWFKIDEAGQKSDGSGWAQGDTAQGKTYTVTLPANILPGDYLIRHEIISLQLAVSVGGAEFYPSCTQVRVSGNGNGAPNATVGFPGAYSDSDPGIYTPDVYNPGFKYVFPGPAIAAFAESNAGSDPEVSANGTTSAPSSASTTDPSTSGSAPPVSSTRSSSSGSCHLVHDSRGYHRKRFSRVMGALRRNSK